jgi:signal transduction histidine kinase
MQRRLRILFAGDATAGPEQIAKELARGGHDAEVIRVADAAELEARLTAPNAAYDAVLADADTPIGVPHALAIVRRASETTTFVVVRYDAGQRAWIDAPPVGSDGRSRLAHAIDHALHEASLRRERHDLREHLVVAERLASVGFLVQGVAHEVNNPPSSIIVNHEFIRAELMRFAAAGVSVADAMATLKDAADAAAIVRQVVRDLRAFARDDASDPESVLDPRPIVESAVRMTWHHVRGRARIVRDLGATPQVRANKARLSQVFLNLLINAAHAIPLGDIDNNQIRVVTRTDERGNFIAEIHDTGTGIAAQHWPAIFDAYFTTKSPTQGTGLGLAVSQRIVRALGGEISVTSEVGKGTCFSVAIPAAQTPDEPKEL